MIKLKENRIDVLYEKASNGDKVSQLSLAKCFYYGRLVVRSLPLARYWAFQAVESDKIDTVEFYNLVNTPHFTGNEQYTTVNQQWNISLTRGTYYSNKFRGKFDVCKENSQVFRTYLVFRLIILYFVIGAYRVYESEEGSYQVLGEEKMSIKEYGKWVVIDLIIIGFILLVYFI